MQDQFGASYFETQLLTNAAQLCVAALVLAAGTLGDLYGRRKWLLVGAVGMFSGFVLQTIATGTTMMAVARLTRSVSITCRPMFRSGFKISDQVQGPPYIAGFRKPKKSDANPACGATQPLETFEPLKSSFN